MFRVNVGDLEATSFEQVITLSPSGNKPLENEAIKPLLGITA